VNNRLQDGEPNPGPEDDGDDGGSMMGTDGRYPRRRRTRREEYNVGHETVQRYGYVNGQVHLQTGERFDQLDELHQDEFMLGVIMTQYSLKKGLAKFGTAAEKAVTKELTQFKDMDVFVPMDPTKLTYEDRKRAVASLMFLKEKDTGEIKGRACANGSVQRKYIKKEDAASPTASTEALFICAAVTALEERAVAILDLPGAFLHADIDEDVIMSLEGPLAELMVKVDPKLYREYITVTSKNKPILYVKMQKAIYGLLRSALLFYKKLVADLKAYGFEVNPYDPCVATMDIEGSQMTVVWHVDDLFISHKDEFQITRLSAYLGDIYGNLSISRGKKHRYLGLDFDFPEKGKCFVGMTQYLIDLIREFPEFLGSTAASPAADHLFKVRDEDATTFLGKEQAEAFHRTVAKLLFASSRVRRDIQTAVSFLTTRVKKPDVDDWGKLKRCLKYIKGTLGLRLCLEAHDMSIIKWWADASYAIHDDCRGHTGAMMSLGAGATTSFSRKQKLNGNSSTHTELFGVHDAMPQSLWTKLFIEALGYKVDTNVIFQDNKSTILLEENGRLSAGKNSKYLHTRFFFIKDCIDAGDVTVEWCPTESMWADVLTKPLNGTPYCEQRAVLMNCPVNYKDTIVLEDLDMKADGACKPEDYFSMKQ